METTTPTRRRARSGAASGAGGSGARATRLTAEERRAEVLQAAVAEFARGGYAGTSTEDIAARAEISQPYLFRLFGTKRDLFVATMDVMHARIEEAFRAAADGKSGIDAMAAMGAAYQELLQERDLLLVQLNAYAASNDDAIRAAARRGLRHLWAVVGELTGLPEDDLRAFFAQGMLLNVLAAVDAGALDESWARACAPDPAEFFAPRATS
jgi:AcrR family transcriptional regulator